MAETFRSDTLQTQIPTGADATALPIGVEALPPLPQPNFCNRCGSSWQPQWDTCPVCRHHDATASEVAIATDESAIGPSLALYFTLLGASAVGMLVGVAGAKVPDLLIGLSIVQALIIVIWTVWARRRVIPSLLRPVAPSWILAGVLGGVCTFLIAAGAIELLHSVLGLEKIRLTGQFLNAGYGWTTLILLVCVQPAVFEELAFRGVILPSLQPSLAAREAIIVSALLFMTLHLSIGSFPHLFLTGLVLGYFRVRTRSLVPGMLLHFTHNLLCILAEHHWG